MALPMLRRLRVPPLDRQVARGAMQICHKIVMQQLYISRVDTQKQWLVISNPSEEPIDLTGYTVADSDATKIFRFPNRYILLAGDEVTIWCSPGSIDLDTDNLLQPYLFWTRPDGSLRHAPFFLKNASNEVILLDPYMIEVASLRISEDGKKDFRVLHCVSSHPRAIRSANDTKFCVGCLAPPSSRKRVSDPAAHSDEVYVFSRYWNVVSDKSLFSHFFAVCLAPVLECLRALLVYSLLAIFQQPNRSAVGFRPGVREKLCTTIALMVLCDLGARRLMLWVKSGLLISLMSFSSVVIDQLAMIATYTSLERLYPDLRGSSRSLLTCELALSCLNVVAVQVGFIEHRRHWHPLFKRLARWDYRWQQAIFVCALGRELLLSLLLVLPMPGSASLAMRILGYVLVPLFTIATGLDFLRGAAMLLYLVKYPTVQRRSALHGHRKRL
ncbi:hypothetical protein ATCC90586_002445 [Pythium insidiosum]|nr:hypothetical protein ATCC90586_002445 [Pythium insidiosum]